MPNPLTKAQEKLLEIAGWYKVSLKPMSNLYVWTNAELENRAKRDITTIAYYSNRHLADNEHFGSFDWLCANILPAIRAKYTLNLSIGWVKPICYIVAQAFTYENGIQTYAGEGATEAEALLNTLEKLAEAEK